MMQALLAAAVASQATAAAGSAPPCSFSLWRRGSPSAGTAGASCAVIELSDMPATVFRMSGGSFPGTYAVTAPCQHVLLDSAVCNSSAVESQGRPGEPCGLPLGMLAQNTTAPLPSGEDGMRILMEGGAGGRTLVYDMICDKAASPGAGPSGLVDTHVAANA